MAYPSVTYVFTNATTASATEINQNYTDLINGLSDGTKDLSISALTCAGTATLNGAVNLGNATSDDIAVNGYITTALIPKADDSYDLGTAALAWQDAYFEGIVYTDAIKALTSAGVTISDDGGNAGVTMADGGAVTVGPGTRSQALLLRKDSSDKFWINLNAYDGTNVRATSVGGTAIVFQNRSGDTTTAGQIVTNLAADANNATAVEVANWTQSGVFSFGKASGGGTAAHNFNSAANQGNEMLVFNKTAVAAGTTSSYFLSFSQSGSSDGYIWHDGSGNLAFANTSDIKVKENIREISGLDKINALHPVMFDWKTKEAKNCLGFIAQEVENVLPQCVSISPTDKETKILSIVNELQPLLVKAIQEQQAIIESLQARITALETKCV